MSEFRLLTSRRARIYIVYEPATKQTIYLIKDSWQVHGLALRDEIICEPQDEKVLIDCEKSGHDGGESEQFTTALPSHKSWKRPKSWPRTTRRLHHRLIPTGMVRPFRTFTSSKHMLLVVSHAFTAHWQAYRRCGIIHRDVSPNNILITSAGGILNDWDILKKENGILSSRLHGRKGIWEFMSSLLVAGHHDTHTIQDDMESFVLVVIYHAIRHLPHNKTRRTLYILNNVFTHRVRLLDGEYGGGEARNSLFLSNGYIGRDFELKSPPLQRWIDAAIEAVKTWIETQNAKSKRGNRRKALELMGEEEVPAIQGVQCPPSPIHKVPLALADHKKLAKYFEICLNATDWPIDDKPYDILPDLKKEQQACQAWTWVRGAYRWRECQL